MSFQLPAKHQKHLDAQSSAVAAFGRKPVPSKQPAINPIVGLLPAASLQINPARTWLPLVFLQVAHGLNEDEALQLIEDGTIYPAVNIGQAGRVRREIRLARAALLSWQPGQPLNRLKLEDVIEQSFPPYLSLAKTAVIKGVDLRARLSCSQGTIAGLIEKRHLIATGTPGAGRGPTPNILFSSVVQFLKSRVI